MQELWDNSQWSNIYAIGDPEEESKDDREKKLSRLWPRIFFKKWWKTSNSQNSRVLQKW